MAASTFETMCPVRRLTGSPGHHFFGYYEKSPWDAADRLILFGEVGFNARMPGAGDVMRLGVIDTADGDARRYIAETRAWCFQQGCMLQWLPPGSGDRVIYNDREADRFVSRIVDLDRGALRTLDRPIYQLDPLGRYALSVNFARLAEARPGYGYEGVADPWRDAAHPAEDGVYRIDLDTGASTLLLSLAAAAMLRPVDSMHDAKHWFNHIQVNRDGSRFAVLHRWQGPRTPGHLTRLLIGDPTTGRTELRYDHGFFSHYDWLGNDTVVGYALVPGTGNDRQFLVLPADGEGWDVLGPGVITADGHNSFSPDQRWMLNDISYSRDGEQTLMLYRMPDGPRIDIARFEGRWVDNRPLRCDLHPRWNRAGTQVCVDSMHDGTRQMYQVDVSGITAG